MDLTVGGEGMQPVELMNEWRTLPQNDHLRVNSVIHVEIYKLPLLYNCNFNNIFLKI